MTIFSPSGPVLVVSTHLDDAVLSCGHFLSKNPQSVVLTVFAGAPDRMHEGYNSITTGEKYAPDAVHKRRNEDAAAMKCLSVKPPAWLDLYDCDYLGIYDSHHLQRDRGTRDHKEIVSAVNAAIRKIGPRSVISPLGFAHLDHVAVSNACVELVKNSDLEWYLYMDMPYAQRYPWALRKRRAIVSRILNIVALEPLQIDTGKKSEAFKLYESQYDRTGGGKP